MAGPTPHEGGGAPAPSTVAPSSAAPSVVERGVGAVAWLAAVLSAGLVLVMLAVVGYSVVMRYFLDRPVTWSDELSGYLVVALVMLGAADALLRGEHISVDLLTARAAGRARRGVELWAMLCVLAVAGAIVYSGREMVAFSLDFGMYSEGYLEAPMWIPQSFILVGGVLLIAAALARIVTLLRPGRQGGQP